MDAVAAGHFAAALLDPEVTPSRRMDVHRNTVVSGLVTALADGFPSVRRLVGRDFFAAMAAEHVRQHPPRHAVLLAYGEDFPGFLDAFGPVAHLPYLADVARLDGLRRRAWHAPDVAALDAGALVGDPEELSTWRVRLHPSVGVLHSRHPARSIWAAQNGDQGTDPIEWTAETSIVWRVNDDVAVAALDAPLRHLLDRLRRGTTLAALLEGEVSSGAELADALGTALQRGHLVRESADAPFAAHDLFAGFLPAFPPSPEPSTGAFA